MTATPNHEIFAGRYATRPARRSDHFIGATPHDGPMPMDDFVRAAHIIRGHDPLVIARFPARSGAMQGVVAKLDVDPARA